MNPEVFLSLSFYAHTLQTLSHIGLESVYSYNPMGYIVRSVHRLL